MAIPLPVHASLPTQLHILAKT
jgi:hypothetical protein